MSNLKAKAAAGNVTLLPPLPAVTSLSTPQSNSVVQHGIVPLSVPERSQVFENAAAISELTKTVNLVSRRRDRDKSCNCADRILKLERLIKAQESKFNATLGALQQQQTEALQKIDELPELLKYVL